MIDPYKVVTDFEQALCEYTGAPNAITTTSCTMALLLTLKLFPASEKVKIPKRTYLGVPMSAINAGHEIEFTDEEWLGAYRLAPFSVWDSARWFTKNLFIWLAKGPTFVCVSFHASKTLGLEQGGAILHNFHNDTHEQLLRLRFDGRLPGESAAQAKSIGYHAPMIPSVAAAGLLKLSTMMENIYAPIPNSDYPDLSQMEIFKC